MIRRYYSIVPVVGSQEIEGVFRTDDCVPYQWNPKTKTWEFNAYLLNYLNGSDLGFFDITEAEAKAFTGETMSIPKRAFVDTDDQIIYGDPDVPVRDWRKGLPEDDIDDPEDLPVNPAVRRLIGFDPKSLWKK